MSYLIFADFKKTIQSDNLLQIIGSDLSILSGIALTAQAQAVSYLTQQFQTSQEFTDTAIYDNKVTYKTGQRVYLDAIAYSASQTYQINELTLQLGQVYYCSTAIPTPQTFVEGNWTLIGAQYDIYFGSYPYPKFDLYAIYKIGDNVFYNGSSYTCLLPTIMYSHEWQLQTNSQQNLQNYFPADPIKGALYWQLIPAIPIPVNSIPNTAFWTHGDNRSSELVMYCCDMALYHIHSRIAPRNIPDLRVKRFDEAIKWLKMASRGEVTADLPSIQPLQGGRIRYSTQVKQINNY